MVAQKNNQTTTKKASTVKNKSTKRISKATPKSNSTRSRVKKIDSFHSQPVHRKFLRAITVLSAIVLGIIGLIGVVTASFSFAATAAGPIIGIGQKCIDNQADRLLSGNKIQLYSCNGTRAQNWVVGTDGAIRIQDYCLDVKSSGKSDGTLVQLYGCNGTAAQKWVVNTDGSIMNPNSNRCLDVQYSGTANGTPIWIWGCNGSSAQKWKLSATAAVTAPAPAPVSSLPTMKLDIDPNTPAKSQADQYRREGNLTNAALMDKIASYPNASWMGGWSGDIRTAVANKVNAAASRSSTAVLVAYNIPLRDCGGYSGGGEASAAAYRTWIDGFAAGIGGRKTIVIIEPDAAILTECLSYEDQRIRYDLLRYAAQKVTAAGGLAYIDAGNSNWKSVSNVAMALRSAGIADARGFSLNVSNFRSTAESVTFGNNVVSQLGGTKKFLVDTSRNGNATNGTEWCNPRGQALGERPTVTTGLANVDAYLWVKYPGESDGYCNGGPGAGQWWVDYALELSRNAKW